MQEGATTQETAKKVKETAIDMMEAASEIHLAAARLEEKLSTEPGKDAHYHLLYCQGPAVHWDKMIEQMAEKVEAHRETLEKGLPCGKTISNEDALAAIKAKKSVPCPCGNPNHWLVYCDVEEECNCNECTGKEPGA